MEIKEDAESNWNKLTTSYHSVFSREFRSTPQIHARDSSSSAVGARRITKKPPSTETSPMPSDRASALGDETSDIEKRYVPRLDFGKASESYRGTIQSARLHSSSSVTRSSASTGKKLPSRLHTARDSGQEKRIFRGTPKQPATRDHQVSGKHATSSRGHLRHTRQEAGDGYPRESVKDKRDLRDPEIPSSVLLSGKRSVSVSGHTTPGRSAGNGSNANATTLTSASNANLVFSARGFHTSHHTHRDESGSLPRPRPGRHYETPREGDHAMPAYPPRTTTPLFSHMPRVGSSSAQRKGTVYERDGVQEGHPDEHASSSFFLRNDAGSTFLTGTSSSATPLEDAHRSAFSFSSVRATDAVDGSSRAARPTRDDAAKSDGPSRSGKKKTLIISASALRSPQPKMEGVCNDSGSVLFLADECIKPTLFPHPVSTSPSQPHPHVESSTGGPREGDVPTVQRHAHSTCSTSSSGTSFSFLSQRKNVKERDPCDEALKEDAKRVSFYDSTEKKSVRNGRENTRTTSQGKEEEASSKEWNDDEPSTSGAGEGGEEAKEERSIVYSRVVESIVDDDAGKFGNRYADGDDPNGGNRTKYYVMPTATIDERLEYLSTLDERRWRREHGRAMKEEGVARRPETLIVTRYGPLKTLTYDGENSAPRAIMAPRPASSTTPRPASFPHGGKELSSSPVLGAANTRESVKNRAYRAGVSETVDHAPGSSHRESSRIRSITPIPTSNKRPLGDVMSIDKD